MLYPSGQNQGVANIVSLYAQFPAEHISVIITQTIYIYVRTHILIFVNLSINKQIYTYTYEHDGFLSFRGGESLSASYPKL